VIGQAVALAGWTGAVPSALLASRPCVQQLKATENRNVCLSDAADVVPIAGAPMRWRRLSSNSECAMVVGAREKGWGDMMAWQDEASNQAKPQQSGAHLRFASFQNLTCSSKSFALHVAANHNQTSFVVLLVYVLLMFVNLCAAYALTRGLHVLHGRQSCPVRL
jgi:hypothetical protein